MNGETEREAADAALSRVTPDQGGSTLWDYRGVARDDPRVLDDQERASRAGRDQGGNSWFDYEEALGKR